MKSSSHNESIIEVDNLTKDFPLGMAGRLRVLRGVTLTVKQGEIIAIVGASGAGKSTLLHIIGTLDRPSTGTVLYDRVDVFALDDRQLAGFRNKEIGFVFQFHHLLPEFTVLENVAMPALIQGKKLGEVRERVLEILDEVGLKKKIGSKPTELSGGEQQRVAVARSLINSPRVILADEPSGNLDTVNAQALHKLLWELSRRHKQTFMIVTHNEGLARQADRVVKIVDGMIQSS